MFSETNTTLQINYTPIKIKEKKDSQKKWAINWVFMLKKKLNLEKS